MSPMQIMHLHANQQRQATTKALNEQDSFEVFPNNITYQPYASGYTVME